MPEQRTGELRVIFLAAGFATRLWPLTKDCAKPLLEVGGEVLLTRLLRQVESTGCIRDVVVVTNERFRADFERWRDGLDTRLPVELVADGALDDAHKLGAIADLALALRAAPGTDPLAGHVVAAADNLFDFDLKPGFERFIESGVARLFVRELSGPIPPRSYNEVELDADGRVLAMREKPEVSSTALASVPVYMLPAELPGLVDDYLAQGGNPDAPGYLIEWLVGRLPFESTMVGGTYFDIGRRSDLDAARKLFDARD